ncbi:MAG: D-Ala-D-Ala carboxypeptidase family metallohydrolase [Pseudomonadota bacterium]
MSDERVTADFWLSEFLASDTAERLAIDNTPPPQVLATLRNVLIPAMQQVRDLLGTAVLVSSGYRSPALNAAIRGSQSSQHVTGHACDFRAPRFGTPRVVARHLVDHMQTLHFDQLIWEGGWVHISFGPRPRSQVLTAHFTPRGVSYTQGVA